MPAKVFDIESSTIHKAVDLLIDNLVNTKDETGEFLLKLDDGRIIDTKGWNDWEWTHGIGLYGLWHYHVLTGSDKAISTAKKWFHDRFEEGTTTKNINTMAVFLTLACIYEKEGNSTYLPYIDSWSEWAMTELPKTKHGGMQHMTYLSDHKNQMWDDTLMMTVVPLAKIGKVLDRPEYIEEAKKQFLLHIRYLCDAKTGLFFHGWKFNDDKFGGNNFAGALWARGNSWLTIVIPELIDTLDLKKGDFFREYLTEVLESQVDALNAFQDKDTGLWHTLLDDPSSYLEASASAGFAFGILKGIRLGLLSKEKYLGTAVSAVKGVLANIDEKGELLQTSFGTGMGDTLQFYKDIPLTSMPYGQAMAMMALVEFLRLYL